MKFQFNLFNHNDAGKRSLEDVIGIVGHQLRALGHEAGWCPDRPELFLPGSVGVNVIVEGFTDYVVGVMADTRRQGARFLIVATEEPTPEGFNHGQSPEMIARQAKFGDAARHADAILHLVPGESTRAWYAQHAPTAFADLGYAPTLVRAPSAAEPEYDFGFFGSLSKRRLKILKALARSVPGHAKAVRVEATFATQTERDRVMRQAKVIVQLRKDEKMGLVSSSRCNTSLCLGRPVIAEPHLLSHPWDQVVRFTEQRDTPDKTLQAFLDACLMARSSWRGLHAAQMERFREKMSPEICLGRALREVGLVDSERVAA